MELLMTLALATCADDPNKCTFTETDRGNVVTVCGLAPDRGGRPISFKVLIDNEMYFVTLEPQCVEV